jgi:hypothetical protein
MSTTLKNKYVKTRKPHRCWGCGQKFESGRTMKYVVNVDSGDFSSGYWCLACDRYLDKYGSDYDDGIAFGEFKGEEHYEEFKIKEFYGVRLMLIEKEGRESMRTSLEESKINEIITDYKNQE